MRSKGVDLSLPDGVVVVDAEISRTIDDTKLWATPWELPVAVACTLSNRHGFRDWIGDRSVAALIKYLNKFDIIVGFNHIKFDYGVFSGSIMRQFDGGREVGLRVRNTLMDLIDIGENDPEPSTVPTLLRGKNVDLLLDIQKHLDSAGYQRRGRKANLDVIAQGTVYDYKASDRFSGGAEAPKAWRKRMCFEVIQYCRKDVELTSLLYKWFLGGGTLKIAGWPESGKVNEIDGKVTLRTR